MPATLTSLTGAILATGTCSVGGAGSSPYPELFIAALYALKEKVRKFGIGFEVFGIGFEIFRTVPNSKF